MPVTGLRGSTSFGADASLARRPENWREMILSLYPNGQAPLTALTALMKSQSTDDPIFHWFEKDMPNQQATVTGVYTDALTTALTAASIAQGTALWVKMSAADVANFKLGHIITIMAAAGDTTYKDPAKTRLQILITAAPTVNGASSFVTGKMINATVTTYASAGYTLATVSGSAYPEGDTLGTAIAYDPTEISNYTQIFRNSLEATRTGRKTRLRTGDQVAQAKKEALELHSIEMEKAFFLNPGKYVTTGSNGQPLRTTAGIRGFITTNKWNIPNETGTGFTAWATTAAVAALNYKWLMDKLEQIFRYGSSEKIAFCGSGALLAIQNMLASMTSTSITLTPTTMAYGIKVQELVTPFGTLILKTHPLFTLDPAFRYDMVILDTEYLVYRYVDDTKYLPNRQANDLDGEKSEYLTEAGLEVHFEKSHAIIQGVGFGATS